MGSRRQYLGIKGSRLQPSTSKQAFKPTKTASKKLQNYLEPEIAKQFDTSNGKKSKTW